MILKSSCVFLFSLLFIVTVGKLTFTQIFDQASKELKLKPICVKLFDKFGGCYSKLPDKPPVHKYNVELKCKLHKCLLIVNKAKCSKVFYYVKKQIWLEKFDEKICLATTQLPSFEVTLSLAQQKCQDVLNNATACAEQNELLEVSETQITILFRKRNSLTHDKKCKLYNCLLPLKPHCDKIFNEYLKLMPNFDVKSCYDVRQQPSSGRIVFSLFISYLLVIEQYCVIIIYNYFN